MTVVSAKDDDACLCAAQAATVVATHAPSSVVMSWPALGCSLSSAPYQLASAWLQRAAHKRSWALHRTSIGVAQPAGAFQLLAALSCAQNERSRRGLSVARRVHSAAACSCWASPFTQSGSMCNSRCASVPVHVTARSIASAALGRSRSHHHDSLGELELATTMPEQCGNAREPSSRASMPPNETPSTDQGRALSPRCAWKRTSTSSAVAVRLAGAARWRSWPQPGLSRQKTLLPGGSAAWSVCASRQSSEGGAAVSLAHRREGQPMTSLTAKASKQQPVLRSHCDVVSGG